MSTPLSRQMDQMADAQEWKERAEAAEAKLSDWASQRDYVERAEQAEAEAKHLAERLLCTAQERADARLHAARVEGEMERLREEKTQIVGYVQRWQPAGSPPSTDALGLVRWIMGSVQEKLDAAETLVDSMAPDGVYEDEIAKARAALRGGGCPGTTDRRHQFAGDGRCFCGHLRGDGE